MRTNEQNNETLRQKLMPNGDEAEDAGRDKWYGGMGVFFGRWARTVALAGTLIWGTYQGIGNNLQYSDGIRTGMVNKFSSKGLIWKTYEGQMALEGIVSNGNSSGANVWDFSIDRQARHGENGAELARKIREYLESGTKVKVTYTEPLSTWPWRSSTDYLIQNVEPVNK